MHSDDIWNDLECIEIDQNDVMKCRPGPTGPIWATPMKHVFNCLQSWMGNGLFECLNLDFMTIREMSLWMGGLIDVCFGWLKCLSR